MKLCKHGDGRVVNARGMKYGIDGGPLQRYEPGALCSVKACQRKVHAQTLCNGHYQSHVRRLGVKPGTYDELYERQQGLCAVCLRPGVARTGTEAELCMDHDHQTGRVRGLLCQGCNRGLGFLRDDPESLLRAVEYLRAC